MPLDVKKLRTPTLREQFERTGELKYPALAIGASPERPPKWALAVFEAYYETERVGVPPPKQGRSPKYSVEDGLALEEVADLVLREKISVTRAILQVTGEEMNGTRYRRLMDIWERNSHLQMLQPDTDNKTLTNKWLDHARKRANERFRAEIWKEAKAEIEAGNLGLEIDPAAEAWRIEHARWFSFSAEVNPEQDNRIQLAPLTRRHHVIEAKKILLRQCQSPTGFTPGASDADENPP